MTERTVYRQSHMFRVCKNCGFARDYHKWNEQRRELECPTPEEVKAADEQAGV